MSEQVKQKRLLDFTVLRRVFQFAAPYKTRFFWSIFLAIFLAVISPVRPWLIQYTINHGLHPGAEAWIFKGAAQVIIGITIGVLIALVIIEFLGRPPTPIAAEPTESETPAPA